MSVNRSVRRLPLSRAVLDELAAVPAGAGLVSGRLAALIQQGQAEPPCAAPAPARSAVYSVPVDLVEQALVEPGPARDTLAAWAHRGLDLELADVLRGIETLDYLPNQEI